MKSNEKLSYFLSLSENDDKLIYNSMKLIEEFYRRQLCCLSGRLNSNLDSGVLCFCVLCVCAEKRVKQIKSGKINFFRSILAVI